MVMVIAQTMAVRYNLAQRAEQRMQIRNKLCLQTVLVGGTTLSIFPDEELLLIQQEYQEALAFVSKRKDVTRYWSGMDFLFCELFPEWREPCFLYYDGEGESLADLVTDDLRREFCLQIRAALVVARRLHREHLTVTWTKFLLEVQRQREHTPFRTQ